MVCRILDSLSCISDSKILDFGSHMQNFPDSFTWGNQKLLKCPSCHNFLSKVGSFEMTSGFKPFTQLFFVKLKDQGFSDNKYCCEDDEVSGLGNLPSETILRVNKDHKPLWIIYFFPPGSLEKHTSELEETRQDSTPLTCMTTLSLRWHKHIKVGKQSALINGVKLSHKIYSVKMLSQGGE